jgi:membrane peptidoglycan carboxypeptidase
MSVTELLSDLSDRLFGALVSKSARDFARALNTPDHFIEILLLIEDKRFPLHFGIDPIAIVRALVFNLRGGTLQGASTISQQIHNIRKREACFGAYKRTLGVKVMQALWALYETVSTTKAASLREYIETVYWGRSIHGIDDAAYTYFQTNRGSLTVAQSFFLAERIAMPNRFSESRVSNLIKRRAIREALSRRSISKSDIAALYKEYCGVGGDMWQLLEK